MFNLIFIFFRCRICTRSFTFIFSFLTLTLWMFLYWAACHTSNRQGWLAREIFLYIWLLIHIKSIHTLESRKKNWKIRCVWKPEKQMQTHPLFINYASLSVCFCFCIFLKTIMSWSWLARTVIVFRFIILKSRKIESGKYNVMTLPSAKMSFSKMSCASFVF